MSIFLSGDAVVLFPPSPLCSSETRGISRYRQGRGGLAAMLAARCFQTPPHPHAGPRPAPKPHGHMGNVSANARDSTRGADNPHVKQWPFLRRQPCELYARPELGATSSARCCPGISLAGFEVSPAFCSRWHSLVLFQALSFWKFLWENLF